VSKVNAQGLTPRARESVLGADTTSGPEVQESGRYAFFSNGERIADKDIVVVEGKAQIRLFTDTNGNGLKDATEEYFTDYSQITLSKEASVKTFKLSAGWNLINIPMTDTRANDPIRTVDDLIDSWNGQGAKITRVAKYSGNQFISFAKRESGVPYGTAFDLIPGEALFVLNGSSNANVSFSGNTFPEGVQLNVTNGWNLVGVVGRDGAPALNSEAVLRRMGGQSIQADTVSQFENGTYQSVVLENDTLFGNNFNVVDTRGYFIKVNSGGGKNFTP